MEIDVEKFDRHIRLLENSPLGRLRSCKHGLSGVDGLRLSKSFPNGLIAIFYYPTQLDESQWVIIWRVFECEYYAGCLSNVLADSRFKKPNLFLENSHKSYIEKAVIYLEDYSIKNKWKYCI